MTKLSPLHDDHGQSAGRDNLTRPHLRAGLAGSARSGGDPEQLRLAENGVDLDDVGLTLEDMARLLARP